MDFEWDSAKEQANRKKHGVDLLYQIINRIPEAREPFWRTFVEVGKKNPNALRPIVTMMAIYLHLGPFSKHVISEIDRRIRELDDAQAMIPPPAYREPAVVNA